MLTSPVFCILTGCFLGFLSGIGVGGGSLLMLWLTLVLELPHTIARTINLLFFIPSALIASLFRRKQGTLDIHKLLPGILAGCISAAVFSYVSRVLHTGMLQKTFGSLLILTGIRELFYRPGIRDQRRRNAK